MALFTTYLIIFSCVPVRRSCCSSWYWAIIDLASQILYLSDKLSCLKSDLVGQATQTPVSYGCCMCSNSCLQGADEVTRSALWEEVEKLVYTSTVGDCPLAIEQEVLAAFQRIVARFGGTPGNKAYLDYFKKTYMDPDRISALISVVQFICAT